MRTHSFPDDCISHLRDTAQISWEEAYRLCGNSIPVLTLRGVVEHLVATVIKPQVLTQVAAAARSHCEVRELAASEREEAARRRRAWPRAAAARTATAKEVSWAVWRKRNDDARHWAAY